MTQVDLEGLEPVEVLNELVAGVKTLLENDPDYFINRAESYEMAMLARELYNEFTSQLVK